MKKTKLNHDEVRIAVVGLGYVGLPLAIEFGKKFVTYGFDINKDRIKELSNSYDETESISSEEFKLSSYLSFTSDQKSIATANIYIVAVPTPLDINNQPDLNNLRGACKIIGGLIDPDDIIIFESTVYPGATEEVCVPILEQISGLTYIEGSQSSNNGFYCGYSPERFAPGEHEKKVTEIIKVTSGSTSEIAEKINNLYQSIITAGTVMASSIKVAEAAKVIENTQRDLNIALVNEFALIFNKLGIDTEEILNIASTKWNFAAHTPGLVGGHCIGVDPYYLAFKATESNIYPQLILSGREINNKMGQYVADQTMQLMTQRSIPLLNSKILIMGFTFKEDCKDIRNTKVMDIIKELTNFGCIADVYDPILDTEATLDEYDINLIDEPELNQYDAIILAVKHKKFFDLGIDKIKSFGKEKHVFFDVKYMFDREDTDGRM